MKIKKTYSFKNNGNVWLVITKGKGEITIFAEYTLEDIKCKINKTKLPFVIGQFNPYAYNSINGEVIFEYIGKDNFEYYLQELEK